MMETTCLRFFFLNIWLIFIRRNLELLFNIWAYELVPHVISYLSLMYLNSDVGKAFNSKKNNTVPCVCIYIYDCFWSIYIYYAECDCIMWDFEASKFSAFEVHIVFCIMCWFAYKSLFCNYWIFIYDCLFASEIHVPLWSRYFDTVTYLKSLLNNTHLLTSLYPSKSTSVYCATTSWLIEYQALEISLFCLFKW